MLKKSIFRFLVTGGTATLIDYCIYMLLTLHININVAKIFSMGCAVSYSFFINKIWTFNNKDRINMILVIKYTICQVINIMVNVSTNLFFLRLTEDKTVAFIMATGIAMTFNYAFQRIIVFRSDDKERRK